MHHDNTPRSTKPLTKPLAGHRFATREGAARACVALLDPVVEHLSASGARARLPGGEAHYGRDAAEMEGVTRLLWGLAPLLAGGGEWAHADRVLAGLHAGTDPSHPDFWGHPNDKDQRWVESAAVGFTMLLAPDRLRGVAPPESFDRMADWLRGINRHVLHANNWRYFRVMVNLGLRRAGVDFDRDAALEDLALLESFAKPGGWYTDGATRQMDYYIPWAMHFYGLIVAHFAPDFDPGFTERALDRARVFAPQFLAWFADSGAALPFGRSLTYRFAQASFLGGYAMAAPDAPEVGACGRAWRAHMRWWSDKPIAHADGTLSIGYAYPCPHLAEQYNAPGSPYWALKAFLPLALGADHPFWSEGSSSDVMTLPDRSVQKPAGLVFDRSAGEVTAIGSGNFAVGNHRHNAAKYAKFAYSTRFAFSVPSTQDLADALAPDSALALSEDGEAWRVRRVQERAGIALDGVAWSVWSPWRDVRVHTWLAVRGSWHVRLHRIETERSLISVEGGWCVLSEGSRVPIEGAGDDSAGWASSAGLHSRIESRVGVRTGEAIRTFPNTNLYFPLATLPVLKGDLGVGTHTLGCAVRGWGEGEADEPSPSIEPAGDASGVYRVVFADGTACDLGSTDEEGSLW